MKIFKKMMQYVALLLALVITAMLIMFFCMFFFHTKFFGYGFKSASKLSETSKIFNTQNIEINSNRVNVEILTGNENNIIFNDRITGIVKGIKQDDGTTNLERCTLSVVDDNVNKKTTITINEPQKGLFTSGNSILQVFINESFLKTSTPNIIINSNLSNVKLNLGDYISNITFNSNGKASLTATSPIDMLNCKYAIGKVICNNNVGIANIETKSGTLQINGLVVGTKEQNGDVNIFADNANVKLNEVKDTLTYRGKEGKSASGGKIFAKLVSNGLTIDSRSFDANISNLTGGCNVTATSKGNLTIDNYTSTSTTKKISVSKGNVNLKNLDVDSIEIETTNGNVNVNLKSEITKQQNNKIDIKTTNGNININAKITNNDVDTYYIGSINAQSTNGDIIIKNINNTNENKCVVNARSNGKGRVVGYFYGIANSSSLETNSGELIVDVKPGISAALLNVIANKKSIAVADRTNFNEQTKLTPIYNAQDMQNAPIITIVSKTGEVTIKEF